MDADNTNQGDRAEPQFYRLSDQVTESGSLPGALQIGDKAPAFMCESTQGEINFPDDFQGKWVIIFSYPSDFTPVCTSEIITLANMQDEFDCVNCSFIGVTSGSVASHIAWIAHIEDSIQYRGAKRVKINIPLIDDRTMKVVNSFGMIHPKSSKNHPLRSVYFIDSTATIRMIMHYPKSVGRSLDEIKRVLIALKAGDEFDIMTPANWMPGDDIITHPPVTVPQARHMMSGKRERSCQAFYFCSKALPKEILKEHLCISKTKCSTIPE